MASYYRSLSAGSTSATGATKAAGVTVTYSDLAWKARLNTGYVSACDCFHASKRGQSIIAGYMFNGMSCSSTGCCNEPSSKVSVAAAGGCTGAAVGFSGSYSAI